MGWVEGSMNPSKHSAFRTLLRIHTSAEAEETLNP